MSDMQVFWYAIALVTFTGGAFISAGLIHEIAMMRKALWRIVELLEDEDRR